MRDVRYIAWAVIVFVMPAALQGQLATATAADEERLGMSRYGKPVVVDALDFSMEQVSSYDIAGRATGVAFGVYVAGQYVYIAGGGSGLRVIDISDPFTPAEVGFYDTPGLAYGVYVEGLYAYVADWSSLRVLDVGDPSSPSEVGFYDTQELVYSVYVVGRYAYVAGRNGLHVLDVGNPSSPSGVSSYDTPGTARDMRVVGGYVYLADGNDGLRVIDARDPFSPVELGSYDVHGAAYGVWLSGEYAYLAAGRGGLRVVDIHDISSPVELSSHDVPGDVRDVYVWGGYAYLAAGRSGVRVVDPASSREVGSYDTPGEARGVHVSDGYVYVADGPAGLCVLKYVGTEQPKLILLRMEDPVLDESGNVEIAGSAGTVDGTPIARTVWDWGDGTVEESGFPGRHQYLNEAIYTVSVTAYTDTDSSAKEASVPYELQDIQLRPDSSHDFGTVIIADKPTSWTFRIENTGYFPLAVYDIVSDNPEFAVSGTTFTIAPGKDRRVNVVFTPALAGSRSATLIITSNDPDEGVVPVSLQGIGKEIPQDIQLSKTLWFGAVAIGGTPQWWNLKIRNSGYFPLEIFDIATSSVEFSVSRTHMVVQPRKHEIVEVGFMPSSLGPRSATLTIKSNDPDEGMRHVSLRGIGKEIHLTGAEYFIDEDPGPGNGTPLRAFDGAFDGIVEEIQFGFVPRVSSAGAHTLYARMQDSEGRWGPVRGYSFFVMSPLGIGVDRDGDVPKAYRLAQNCPNPFNPSTVIGYDVPRAGSVRVTIYGLNGQHIRTLINGEHAAGRYSEIWDGRDAAGRDVASGVYLCRMVAGEYRAVRKLVLVR